MVECLIEDCGTPLMAPLSWEPGLKWLAISNHSPEIVQITDPHGRIVFRIASRERLIMLFSDSLDLILPVLEGVECTVLED